MSKVIQFTPKLPQMMVFHCTECECECFVLKVDGTVMCAECDAEMNNITVVENP